MKKRARGGAFGMKETNGQQDAGPKPAMPAKEKVVALGKKTSNGGFASGGSIDGEKGEGNLAKRARGGGVFSAAHSSSDRNGKSDSGHEGE